MICEIGISKVKTCKSKSGTKYHIIRPWGKSIRAFCGRGVNKNNCLTLDINDGKVCKNCISSLNKTLEDKNKILKKLSFIF